MYIEICVILAFVPAMENVFSLAALVSCHLRSTHPFAGGTARVGFLRVKFAAARPLRLSTKQSFPMVGIIFKEAESWKTHLEHVGVRILTKSMKMFYLLSKHALSWWSEHIITSVCGPGQQISLQIKSVAEVWWISGAKVTRWCRLQRFS